jgi:hypothetical protein
MACSCVIIEDPDPVIVLADCANASCGAEFTIPDINDNIVGIKMRAFLCLITEHDDVVSII